MQKQVLRKERTLEEQQLKEMWQTYGSEKRFNYSKIKDRLGDNHSIVKFKADEPIVMRGDFPTYIYFIRSGVAIGIRDYEDGSEYDYFQLDETNGSIGLLETLAQKEEIIATITCLTEVTAVRVPSATVYQWIMQDLELLRLSANLLADDLYHRSGSDGLFYQLNGVDRLRYYLVEYYDKQVKSGDELVEIQEIREKIGHKLGLSVRTVGRSLKKLRDNKEIVSIDRKIYVGSNERQRLQKHLIRV